MTTEEPKVKPLGLYSIQKTAEALCIHRSTVYAMIKDLRIVPLVRKSDGRMVIRGSEILKTWNAVYGI